MAGKLDQTAAKLNSGDSPGLRALKILVVVMGILIVAGVATIVVTIVSRISDKASQADAKAVAETVAPATLTGFGDVAHAVPAGARVISVSADSGRLYVHYQTAGGRAVVLVLNGADGAKLGALNFEPAR